MSLSCSCGDGDYAFWYTWPDDYERLSTPRWRRCCSCKTIVRPGDLCAKFTCWKTPEYDSVAERIYGDEQPLPDKYMCEACADQYFNLSELGFCITLGGDMRRLLREYVEMNRERLLA